ncbi:COX15/CtaA family protein [Pseudoalteromonas sp. MM17-2]|uniref:COX15/CtaA family protein n=1 Tax=Pseudoalteromonas sp. MM17-2 TaxID=2917753 RepID=UPI001EF5BF70|nr:COX15/CtaA family protein [Pseudoalteromonas sp. MM17-2]MCG7544714.1 COX15/CtaA family protein [Pseudoalteromonas sp. MM17-2]
MTKNYKTLVLCTAILAVLVVGLGAYTRLSDAGLGCPDWPGCYGFLTVPDQAHEIQKVQQHFPGAQVDQGKALKEMVHRYFAGGLGLLILALAVYALRHAKLPHVPLRLPMVLLLLVIFQALLGMWTVTMNLQPLVVMGHLLGGFSIASLLWLLYLRTHSQPVFGGDPGARASLGWSLSALVVVVIQIALGGWLAANYAATHCIGFPMCAGSEAFSLSSVFQLPTEHSNYEFGVLSFESRMSIHLLHRFGAFITAVVLLSAMWQVFRSAQSQMIKQACGWVVAALVAQISLGIALVQMSIPLNVALAHNLMALLLLLTLVRLCYLQKSKS